MPQMPWTDGSIAMKISKKKRPANNTLDKLWSKKVKELAGQQCEICHETKGLSAHHIQPRKIYSTRWFVPNGICLCKDCHVSSPFSAHKNPLSFILALLDLRGREWAGRLALESVLLNWQDRINEIKEALT